jgi:hypothetical protein
MSNLTTSRNCSKCGKSHSRKNRSYCSDCEREYQRNWRATNPESHRKSVKKYDDANKGQREAWLEKNADALSKKAHQRYLENREAKIKSAKAQREKQRAKDPVAYKEEERVRAALWRAKNAERLKPAQRQYENTRFKEDSKYRVRKLITNRIRQAFKAYCKSTPGSVKWESILGYSWAQLESKLKGTIPAGYTWQDFLDGKLHIDHKKPIASFNWLSVEDADFKECWGIGNLQLLPEFENKSKGARLLAS